MSKPKSDYSIQTVSNALRLLQSFEDKEELGVSELSRRLGLHKNNVFRLLATLEESGYIEQSVESERYRLGARCLELGCSYSRRQTLLTCARPILERLSADVGESAHLGVMRDFEVVHLDGIQPQQLVLTALRTGQRLPVHCTALGKALLAASGEEVRRRFDESVVAETGLPARTDGSTTDASKFFEQLRTCAVQGFAFDLEECEVGLHCVAAPIWDESGRVLAALSISAPAFRMPEDALFRRVADRVASAATELSRELGYAA